MLSRLEQETAIRQYYDSIVEEEEFLARDYPFEFEVTLRFITKYLDRGARLLDAACGTGRYGRCPSRGRVLRWCQ